MSSAHFVTDIRGRPKVESAGDPSEGHRGFRAHGSGDFPFDRLASWPLSQCLLGQEHRLNQLRRFPWGGGDALALVNVNEDKVYFGTKHLLVGARAYLGDLEALRQASRDNDPLVRAMSALALGRQKPRAECISLLKRMSAEASTELEKVATEAGLGLHAASDGKELHSALVQAAKMDAELLDHLTREVKREIVDSLISACGLDDPRTVAWSVHLGLNPASVRDEVALLRALKRGSYETNA